MESGLKSSPAAQDNVDQMRPQLVIYVGYLKKKLAGGILAGLTFILARRVSDDRAELVLCLSWRTLRQKSP